MTEAEIRQFCCEVAWPLWERGYEVRWERGREFSGKPSTQTFFVVSNGDLYVRFVISDEVCARARFDVAAATANHIDNLLRDAMR